MYIDWPNFTPISALAGGALIGAAAGLLVLGAGRILGAAGVVAGALGGRDGDAGWRWALIAGLVASALVARLAWGAPSPSFAASAPLVALAGLLVGFGARVGSGCTSGHGVCGLARLSPRSFVATGVFMAAGFATTFLVRHVFA